jgi:hypothetical protein
MRSQNREAIARIVLDRAKAIDVDGVRELVEQHPWLKGRNAIDGLGLLEVALRLHSLPLLRSLIIDAGVTPNKNILDLAQHRCGGLTLKIPHGVSLFAYSCDLGDTAVSQFLFNYYVASLPPDFKADVLLNCLGDAAGSNDVVYVRWLVELGADISGRKKKATPLINVASTGANEAILALLELGADINQKSSGWDALWTSVINRNYETVPFLLQKGADPYNSRVPPDKKYPDLLPTGNALDAAHALNDSLLIELLTRQTSHT